MAKKIKMVLAAALLLLAVSGCGVKQIRDQVTVEAGQELELWGEDFFEAGKRELEKLSFDLSQVNVNQVGSYPVTAAVGKKKYGITVHVADRTPPMVELTGRVIFTDDLKNYDPMELIEGVYDASAYTVELIRYAREAELGEISDIGWRSLKALLMEPVSQEELEDLGTVDIPEEEGIYRGVLAVADIYDNVWLEQLWIVLEKHKVTGENTQAAVENMDDAQAAAESVDDAEESFPIDGSENGRDSSLGAGGSVISGGGAGAAGGNESTPETDPTYYDTHLEEGQLAAINAGYYRVVPDPRYGGYIVMVHGGESSYGTQLIREYLATIGCEAVGGSGDWISMDADQYAVYVTAEEIRLWEKVK